MYTLIIITLAGVYGGSSVSVTSVPGFTEASCKRAILDMIPWEQKGGILTTPFHLKMACVKQ